MVSATNTPPFLLLLRPRHMLRDREKLNGMARDYGSAVIGVMDDELGSC